ncbi:hypothetical protein M501DRAFT_1013183 [Patellaria atrata CBS 101060]|uniref:Uncharacterized protein n=1 Tax=Patellaria atrata CBS 101060 TaxID=1346257 RepID=A0A9P4SF91_9PEZI|nr:hypothetical protein M501DRAFT_1013183 [Patellaria atrata CBS 101060]
MAPRKRATKAPEQASRTTRHTRRTNPNASPLLGLQADPERAIRGPRRPKTVVAQEATCTPAMPEVQISDVQPAERSNVRNEVPSPVAGVCVRSPRTMVEESPAAAKASRVESAAAVPKERDETGEKSPTRVRTFQDVDTWAAYRHQLEMYEICYQEALLIITMLAENWESTKQNLQACTEVLHQNGLFAPGEYGPWPAKTTQTCQTTAEPQQKTPTVGNNNTPQQEYIIMSDSDDTDGEIDENRPTTPATPAIGLFRALTSSVSRLLPTFLSSRGPVTSADFTPQVESPLQKKSHTKRRSKSGKGRAKASEPSTRENAALVDNELEQRLNIEEHNKNAKEMLEQGLDNTRTGSKRKARSDDLKLIPAHLPGGEGYGLPDEYWYGDISDSDEPQTPETPVAPSVPIKHLTARPLEFVPMPPPSRASGDDEGPARKKRMTPRMVQREDRRREKLRLDEERKRAEATRAALFAPPTSTSYSPTYIYQGTLFRNTYPQNVDSTEQSISAETKSSKSTEDNTSQTKGKRPVRNETPLQRELRRNGHVEGTGTFCVPEHSSDEDNTDNTDNMDDTTMLSLSSPEKVLTPKQISTSDRVSTPEHISPPENVSAPGQSSTFDKLSTPEQEPESSGSSVPVNWSTAPPPRPTPAHAELPVKGFDAVKRAREQAQRYAPKTGSRLAAMTNAEPEERASSPAAVPTYSLAFPRTSPFGNIDPALLATVNAEYGSLAAHKKSHSDFITGLHAFCADRGTVPPPLAT